MQGQKKPGFHWPPPFQAGAAVLLRHSPLPAAQAAGKAPANASLVPQRTSELPSHNAARGARYMVQAPVRLSRDVQEIRVGLPGVLGAVGSVRLRPGGGGRVYISDLHVAPEHRRLGIAGVLVQAAVRTAASQGRNSAVLEAMPGANSISPQALVSMYQRLGFRQTGISKDGRPLLETGSRPS